ncbi:MAG: metallophosphoesterase family protein [Bryobacterales bacterium]|nr:metallophosphoesterase family protein [Bryobacterales bacterium]
MFARPLLAGVSVVLACACFLLPAQQRGRAGKRGPQSEVFHTSVPERAFDLILTRPTNRSVTASILAYDNLEGFMEYGARPGVYPGRTARFQLSKGEPRQVVLEALQPDTRYYYRLRHRTPGASGFAESAQWTFHTQRAPAAPFTFAVQADSHLDENASPDVYRLTLGNMLAAKPDFLIDLGDTFMTDKRRSDFRQALPQYLAQRYYFGLVGHSTPLFLVLGNHDGEGGSRAEMAEWSIGLRRRFFPNPRPDAFYTGNREPLENYYAWEWGSALFLVLDPYWPTTSRARGDNWNWTLGPAQYRWLGQVLASSKSRLKFVFIHHPVGGKDQPIRGGIEAAKYNEWGGRNSDSSDGFKSHRPGWEMPVHQLLVKHKVSIVFHGHDHMFAREELDGVVYQLVPQPGQQRAGAPRNAKDYGYVHGPVLGGAGYVRVEVAQDEAIVDYVLSLLPQAEAANRKNGAASYSYRIRSGAGR